MHGMFMFAISSRLFVVQNIHPFSVYNEMILVLFYYRSFDTIDFKTDLYLVQFMQPHNAFWNY